MEPVRVISLFSKHAKLYTKEEIKELCSGHVITDLKIERDLPPAVTEFAPLVTTLYIEGLTSINSLE